MNGFGQRPNFWNALQMMGAAMAYPDNPGFMRAMTIQAENQRRAQLMHDAMLDRQLEVRRFEAEQRALREQALQEARERAQQSRAALGMLRPQPQQVPAMGPPTEQGLMPTRTEMGYTPSQMALAEAYPEQVIQAGLKEQFAQPTATQRLIEQYRAAGPEERAIIEKFMPKAGGVTVQVGTQKPMTETGARQAAMADTMVTQMDELLDLTAGKADKQRTPVDLSGVAGKWAEFEAGTGWGPALIREVFGEQDPYTTRAVGLAKQIETQAKDFLVSGVPSDKDAADIRDALGLIGGPDTPAAVRRLRGLIGKYETGRRGYGGYVEPEYETGAARGIREAGNGPRETARKGRPDWKPGQKLGGGVTFLGWED